MKRVLSLCEYNLRGTKRYSIRVFIAGIPCTVRGTQVQRHFLTVGTETNDVFPSAKVPKVDFLK